MNYLKDVNHLTLEKDAPHVLNFDYPLEFKSIDELVHYIVTVPNIEFSDVVNYLTLYKPQIELCITIKDEEFKSQQYFYYNMSFDNDYMKLDGNADEDMRTYIKIYKRNYIIDGLL